MVASKRVLPNPGGDVTRDAVLEYARAVSSRYLKGGKREKGRILDEFCKTTGHHRKSAVRLLRNPPAKARGVGVDGAKRQGRPKAYGFEVVSALRQVWEVSDRLCSKRLAPFVPELTRALEQHGEIALSDDVRGQLQAMSASTMDRLLKPYRDRSTGLRRPYTTRRSQAALKALIPIRTFGEWADVGPGSVQADLVAHCGESTEGFYLNSLVLVDVATSWCELEVIWGKGKERVSGGVHRARSRLPFPLAELHTDNGSEFINDLLYPYTTQRGHSLHQRARLSQERPSLRRAEELVGAEETHRLRPLQLEASLRADGEGLCPRSTLRELLPAGREADREDARRREGEEEVRRGEDALPAASRFGPARWRTSTPPSATSSPGSTPGSTPPNSDDRSMRRWRLYGS